MGYCPGFYYIGDGYLYWWDIDASAVVPAQDDYTTKITDLDDNPIYDFYGIDVGTVLGSGNPGDDNLQYGVNIEVLGQAPTGKWGLIRVYNQSVAFDTTYTEEVTMKAPGTYAVTYQTVVENTGVVTATDVYVTYTLDADLTPAWMGSTAGTVLFPQATAWRAEELYPGDVATVTLVTTGTAELPLEADTLSTQVDAHDGMTARGPWFFSTDVVVPTVSFVTPTDGQAFYTLAPTLTVPIEVATTDFTIPDDGHWHLWLDGAMVGEVMTYTTSADLAVGTHAISSELRLADHTVLGPVATVNVMVGPFEIYLPTVMKNY
jgi:uncharacterized repeat protein (TIGR01451 family)